MSRAKGIPGSLLTVSRCSRPLNMLLLLLLSAGLALISGMIARRWTRWRSVVIAHCICDEHSSRKNGASLVVALRLRLFFFRFGLRRSARVVPLWRLCGRLRMKPGRVLSERLKVLCTRRGLMVCWEWLKVKLGQWKRVCWSGWRVGIQRQPMYNISRLFCGVVKGLLL